MTLLSLSGLVKLGNRTVERGVFGLFCGECGAENREGRKFCTNCGSALAARCSNCGSELEPDERFCGECGTPVGGPREAPSITQARSKPIAERRLVSVMFVDLVGFTSHSETRDPEDVRLLLSDYFQRAEEIIGLYGGVVEKFIGDAVMAVWGTPVAREDDTGRAVRAALEVVEAVAALGRSIGADLQARAGVFTGEAAVNIGAKGQGMVAGDMVNTASRLQSAAQPGSVLVDRATYLGARDAVAFEEIGSLTLKGKDEPVDAWRALRVIGFLGGVKQADSLEPAFTGRDEELRMVKDLLHSTGRERKPKLASIVGVGGIGKSRLIWELYKYVDGLSDVLLWHQGRSPSYGEGVAFWALAEMVRMRARIAETDDDESAGAKLDGTLAEFVPEEEERAWLRPYLAQLIGLEEGGETQQEQLFAAWRTFFERLAEQGTVILIFEDLHWADPGLIDFIEHMMSWARSSPILTVTLARPELMDRRPNWGAGQRNFVSIHLEPLGDDDMTLLLKSLTGDLPGTIQSEIVQRSEGVPLYAVEMIRMLIDRRDLVPEGSGFRWSGEAEHIDVPDSLHSLIASRLDVLATDDRLLVQDAAILGKTFTTPALAEVTGNSVSELEPRLQALVRKEIFSIDTDPRSPERGQFGFVQSLIREVAYQTLSNQDRRDRHLAAARYFETTGELDLIDVVATHYVEAYNNSKKDDESAPIAERARIALMEAAARASALGSGAQSLTLLEKALSVAHVDSDRGEILLRAGRAALHAGRFDKGAEYLKESIDLLEETADLERLADAQAELGQAYFLTGQLDESERMLLSAIGRLDDPGNSPAGAKLYTQLARMCVFKGDQQKCEEYISLAMPAAERAGDVSLIAAGLITRGVSALLAGRTHETEALLRGALVLAERHGLLFLEIRALVNITSNELAVDPSAALATARKGIDKARRFGIDESLGFLIGNAIEATCHLAKWDEGRSLIAEGSEDELGDLSSITHPAACMLEAYAGNLEEAKRHLAAFEGYAADSTSLQDQDALAATRGTVALVEGRFDDALRAVINEWAAFVTVAPYGLVTRVAVWGSKLEAARAERERMRRSTVQNEWQSCNALTLDAGIAALTGDRDRAIELYNEAIATWNELEIPLGKALCQMDFALALGGPEAAAASDEAERFFAEAGNQHFVNRLKAAR
ncbi:MAG: AAA family ATPase [Actinomycetota bacterium]|nr:AAA family ATPase [Actinomycetota bacterium]